MLQRTLRRQFSNESLVMDFGVQYIAINDSLHDFFATRNTFASNSTLMKMFTHHVEQLFETPMAQMKDFVTTNHLESSKIGKIKEEKIFSTFAKQILHVNKITFVTQTTQDDCKEIPDTKTTEAIVASTQSCWRLGSREKKRGLYVTVPVKEQPTALLHTIRSALGISGELRIVKDQTKIQESLLCPQPPVHTMYSGVFDKFDTKPYKEKKDSCYESEFQSYSITKAEGALFYFDALKASHVDKRISWVLGENEQKLNTLKKVKGVSPGVATFTQALQDLMVVDNPKESLTTAAIECVYENYKFAFAKNEGETMIRDYILGLMDLKRGGDFMTVKAAYQGSMQEKDKTYMFLTNDRMSALYALAIGVPTGLTNNLKVKTGDGMDSYLALYNFHAQLPASKSKTKTKSKTPKTDREPVVVVSKKEIVEPPKTTARARVSRSSRPSRVQGGVGVLPDTKIVRAEGTMYRPMRLVEMQTIVKTIAQPNFNTVREHERSVSLRAASRRRVSQSTQLFADWNINNTWLDAIYSTHALREWYANDTIFATFMHKISQRVEKISFFDLVLYRFIMFHYHDVAFASASASKSQPL